MISNKYPDYLQYDRQRKLRLKQANQLQVFKQKAIKLAIFSTLAGLCIYSFFLPVIQQALASTTPAPQQDEEPAIPEPSTVSAEPKKVQVEVVIDWTRERIEKEIRKTFHETPNTAVAVATEEGGLHKVRQSDIYKNGVREPSFCTFQIHEPTWGKEAKRLGYGDYKTNPAHCIAMARHIYDTAGQSWSDWSAYNNGSYLKHLE